MDKKIDFLVEIDKLKNVIRSSPLVDSSRRENSAEHSWHLAMYALILADEAPEGVDINRVIRMLLIHDIVEIDAGDHPIYGSTEPKDQQEKELKAADRLFGLLPEELNQQLKTLWLEFEAGETPDAAFAKSLDRFQPLIHNVKAGGGTWAEFGVSKEQATARYEKTIPKGSPTLWKKAKELMASYFG
ncbi:HD domain-containing protein [Sessilibacter sp. MAH1]